MSLNRYFNKSVILDKNYPSYGKLYDPELSSLMNITVKDCHIMSLQNNEAIINSEIHLYSFIGDIMASSYNSNVTISEESRELLFDVRSVFVDNQIETGSYKAVFNTLVPLIGSINNKILEVTDISPDRTEIQINIDSVSIASILEILLSYQNTSSLNNVIINFGENQIYNIINFRYDANGIYFKTYQTLSDVIDLKSKFFIGHEIADPYIDSLIITHNILPSTVNKIRGPRFNQDADQIDNNSTIYKSWEELLSTDQVTSQNIIDKLLNIDESVTLNVDYTNFENYIFYSSAEKRIVNFFEKVTMIDKYNQEITDAKQNTGSFINIDVEQRTEFIDKIRNSFGPFERWLYYDNNNPIFTHGLLGPITSYPKTISDEDGSLQLKAIDDPSVLSWYNSLVDKAIAYDKLNTKSLWWSIPEHILMDEGNSEYVLFVEMIGQHFDNIWLYIKALTNIHSKDEHPERGAPNELLFNIAKSFGWNLQNSNILSDLWLYKEAVLEDGTSTDQESHEEQTHQIWKRIVNNLPYLLKTKGTSRSIRALMSIYGIPKTLVSIKEYGGPGLESDKPIMIEDRYHYKLKIDPGQYVETTLNLVDCDYNGWAPEDVCDTDLKLDFKNPIFEYGLQHYTLNGDMPSLNFNHPNGGKWLAVEINDSLNIYQIVNLIPNVEYTFNASILSSSGGSYSFKHNDIVIESSTDNPGTTIAYTFAAGESDKLEFDIGSASQSTFLGGISLERITSYNRYPDTYEFRFQFDKDYAKGDSVYLGGIERTDGNGALMLYIYNDPNEEETFGQLYLLETTEVIGPFSPQFGQSAQSKSIPLFNKDMWTVRISFTGLDRSQPTDTIIDIASAGNCLYGKLTHSDTFPMTASALYYLDPANNSLFKLGGQPVSPYLDFTLGAGSLKDFDGYIQGYKEYFGTYSSETFTEHVLNPAAYSVDDFKLTKYSLWKYFPLGLDLQRWPHDSAGSNDTHESSQPDRNISPNPLVLYNFTDDQTENYINDNETYYINVPKIGGRTVQSQKIRIDDQELSFTLSPDKSAILDETNPNPDENRLAIVFSLADQINRDIYNHMGVSNLDDYIADPESEFEPEYYKFKKLRSDYFSKYTQKNDINAFIRILSVYDYTFFDQIKQLVPARANLISGILIEPHILERNKVVITKRPSIEAVILEDDIDLNIWDRFAENLYLETTVSPDILALVKTSILKGVLTTKQQIELIRSYLKAVLEMNSNIFLDTLKLYATIPQDITLIGSLDLASQRTGSLDVFDSKYQGFIGDLEIAIDQVKTKSTYKLKTPVYSPYTRMEELSGIKYFNSIDKVVVDSGINSFSPIHDPEYRVHPRYEFAIELTTGQDLSANSISMKQGQEYEIIIYASSILGTTMTLSTIPSIADPTTTTDYIINDRYQNYARPAITRITPTVDQTVDIYLQNTGNTIILYSIEVYKYISTYEKQLLKLYNKSQNIVDFYWEDDHSYQINENSTENNKRFRGSKLTGPDFNIPSNDTIDKGPVVSFTEVNPNQLINSNENSSSNLIVE